MKAEHILALFNQIEKDFEVDQWTIDGIHVWPLIRLDMMMGLHFEESEKLQIKITLLFKIRQAFGMIFGYVRYIFQSLRDMKNNAKIHPVDAVILGDGIARVFLNGKWHDRFCDPLVHDLSLKNKTSLVLEPLHNYIVPRYSPSIFIQHLLDFSLLKNFIFKKKHFKHIELKDFQKFVEYIQLKKLRIPLPDENRLKIIVLTVKSYAEHYKKILKLAKPSQGFVVCYYGPRGLAFNLACHQLGIPSVDIQHGVAGEYNPAYGQWNKVPPSGYEVLPSIFWCWTKEDALAIRRWNKNVTESHRAVLSGNMFADFWKNASIMDKKIDNNSFQSLTKKKEDIHILVTLSSVENHNNLLLSKIIEVMKHSDARWKWWIRLHPCLLYKKKEVKKTLQEARIQNFEIDQATDLPLYLILPHMDIHITYVSATVVEACMFGVRSIVTGEDAVRYFSAQISSGWAVYSETPDKITQAIKRLSSSC
ncbi:hypothetical protein HYV57_00735 [Candidatus Peregrinibacteria bacterium]|nr:hypothetical protein [Candidatus Peregrinibacteria bacterium]